MRKAWWCVLLGWLCLCLCLSCGGGTPECVNDIQLSDYNTSGLKCTKTCDCSNLKYEGHCVDAACVANARTEAQRKGEIRSCKLLRKVGSCEWGEQVAQPEPLKELLWGNCIAPKSVDENTAALCADGKDNDCNGLVDDKDPGCKGFCGAARTEPCYTGTQGTLNQGICRLGFRACAEDGRWGSCQGQVVEKVEICNGQDDDCNGLVDDGLSGCNTTESCSDGSQKPCYAAPRGCVLEKPQSGGESFRCEGACRAGSQRCVAGKWGICEGAILPTEEKCDGFDNDCNGQVDDGCACVKDTDCGQGLLCVMGACKKKGCLVSETECAGACVDTKTSARHCGSCGKVCEQSGYLCVEGTCTPSTPSEILIKAGTFLMGSPTSELGRESNETQFQVTLTRSFLMGKHEVTQHEFQARMGYNPSSFSSCGENCPVEKVSWHEAAAYCNAISRSAGLTECFTCTGAGASLMCDVAVNYAGSNYYDCSGYRLPTEAEWEYAYRAGTTTAFYNGSIADSSCADPNGKAIAWYCGNAQSKTHPVGGKQPNAWGLYDMAGNVWEWVFDWYGPYPTQPSRNPVGAITSTYRIRRGGSFLSDASYLRAALRVQYTPTYRDYGLGFRVVRSSP